MTRADDLLRIKGYLIPTFTKDLPGGRRLNGLDDYGVKMVTSGYACGNCLAYFDRFTLRCPSCLSWHDPSDVLEPPQMWLDYLAERNAPEPVEKPKVLNPFEAIQAVSKNPDVEQIPLSKLRERKRKKK